MGCHCTGAQSYYYHRRSLEKTRCQTAPGYMKHSLIINDYKYTTVGRSNILKPEENSRDEIVAVFKR